MKKLLPLLLLFICFNALQAQTWTELGGVGTSFSAAGAGAASVYSGQINAIALDKSGYIYAGGDIRDKYTGNNIVVKWNGSSWSELGVLIPITGGYTTGTINSITVDNQGNVYAAGDFTDGNGNRYIAEWNGTSWIELGGAGATGLKANYTINTIVADEESNIYAGITLDGGFTYNVQQWNKTSQSWNILGSGSLGLNANDAINSIAVDDSGNVYAAGVFTNINDDYYVAKWNGTSWIELGGTGITSLNANDIIHSIAVDDSGNVYAGGDFTFASSGYSYIAKWNEKNKNWSELGANANGLNGNDQINTIVLDSNGKVYAAGYFTDVSSNSYVAQWNGTNWTETGGNPPGANGEAIEAIALSNNGYIYAGGAFIDVADYNYVAQYKLPLPPTVTSPVTLCQTSPSFTPLTANPSEAGATLNWYGTNATGGVASATAPTPSRTAATSTYYVSQTLNGAESPRAAIVVTVYPGPNNINLVGPSGNGGPFNICELGSNTAGSALIYTTNHPGYTYQWNTNPSSNVYSQISGATNSFYAASPSAGSEENYIVVVTDSNGCTSQSVNISVRSVNGSLTFSSDTTVSITSSSPATFCPNSNTTLKSGVPSAALSDTLTFKWYNAGTAIGADSSATDTITYYKATASGNYYVTYEVGSATGNKCYFSSPVITVTEDVIKAGIHSVLDTICSGDSVKLSAVGISGIRTITYQWDTNGTAISGATNSSYAAILTAGVDYTLVVSDNFCSIPVQKSIAVRQLPTTPTIVASSSNPPYCSGQVTFSVQNPTGSYQWYNNDTAIVGATSSSYLAQDSGAYSVSAVSGGCPSKQAVVNNYVHLSPPKLPVSLANGASNSFCAGDSVALLVTVYTVANSGSSKDSLAYGRWYNGITPLDSVKGNQNNQTDSTLYAKTTGSYYVRVYNAAGCFTPSDTVNVTAYPVLTTLPTISSGSSTTFCSGDSVTLSATPSSGYPYQWYNGTTAISGATSPAYTATTQGSYTVKVGLPACSKTSVATTVTVNPLPVTPTISAGGSTTFCPGDSLKLTGSSTTAGVSYQWLNNGAAITGATNSIYNAKVANSYTIVAISAAPASCSSDTSLATVVTLYSVPSAPAVSSPDSLTQGITAAALTATGSSLLWYTLPNGGTGSATLTPSVADTGTTDYYVTQTVNGCESPRAELTVIVSPGVPLPTLSSDSLTYCLNATPPSLSQNVTPSAGGKINWYGTNATGGTASSTPPSLNITTAGTTYYYVSQTIKGKESPRAKITVVVTSQSIAIPVITPSGAGTTCDNITLQASSSNSSSVVSYVWYLDNGLILDTLKNQYMPVTDGAYTVSITLQNGCTAISKPFQVSPNVNSMPLIIDSGSVPAFMICTTKASATKMTYQWYADDKVIIGADSAKFPILYNATYNVAVTYFSGADTCRFNSPQKMETGQKQTLRQMSFFNNNPNSVVITAPFVTTVYNFSAYPNPANDKLNISYSGGSAISIKLYNTLGEAVLNTEQSNPSGNYQLQLPLSYASGLYILSLTDGGHTVTQKIIIE